MKEPNLPTPPARKSNFFINFFWGVLAILPDAVVWPIFVGYFAVCFWLFDRFGISNPDTQLGWVVAPIFVGGFFVTRRLIRKSWGE